MPWGIRTGAGEAIRLAKQYAEANGMAWLNCVDAHPYPSRVDNIREKGLTRWTVRFDGLPPGPCDDGSVLVLVDLEAGEVKRLGGA